MATPRSGTLIVKTSDMSVDVVLRDQLRYLAGSSLAPIAVAAGNSGRLEGIARREGVDVHPLPLERDPSPMRDLRALFELIRLMRRLRPELVVYGTPKATLLAGAAALCTGVPARVQVLHGLRLETTTGLARRLLLATEKLAVRMSTHTMAVGHGVLRRCAELGIDTRSMSVVGRGSVVGIDTRRAALLAADPEVRRRNRAALGTRDDELVVGFVGRVTRDKGIETLVRAVARLRDTGLAVRLAVVGIDEGIGALDDDAQRLLREPWVTLTGDLADPIEMYTAFDAFCLPSYREGLSTVTLEAWAAGVPVVTSDSTGLGDLVDDGRTGLVVPIADTDATARALMRVLTDTTLRGALRRSATAEVEEHFAREGLWARCLAYYETARDERARRR